MIPDKLNDMEREDHDDKISLEKMIMGGNKKNLLSINQL